jgi:hypothetical protein
MLESAVQEKPCNLPASTADEDALTEAEIASMFAEARALDAFFSNRARQRLDSDSDIAPREHRAPPDPLDHQPVNTERPPG